MLYPPPLERSPPAHPRRLRRERGETVVGLAPVGRSPRASGYDRSPNTPPAAAAAAAAAACGAPARGKSDPHACGR
eukprot:gene36676-24345_t